MASNKKLLKKQRRKELLFLKDESELEVIIQSTPSAHLLVANGGLGNGLSRRALAEIVSTQHLYMPPGKKYAFATFSSVSEAAAVVSSVNGACLQDISAISHTLPPSLAKGPPLHLYLSYIKEVPEVVMGTQAGATPSPLPPGLVIIPEFVSPSEEDELLSLLDSAHSSSDSSHAPRYSLKLRQVIHYGYEFNYKTNGVDHASPLPGEFPPLIKQLMSRMLHLGHTHYHPDQVTVNIYPPGAGM